MCAEVFLRMADLWVRGGILMVTLTVDLRAETEKYTHRREGIMPGAALYGFQFFQKHNEASGVFGGDAETVGVNRKKCGKVNGKCFARFKDVHLVIIFLVEIIHRTGGKRKITMGKVVQGVSFAFYADEMIATVLCVPVPCHIRVADNAADVFDAKIFEIHITPP